MGLYSEISNARYSEGGVYITPGIYRMKILACKHITTRKRQQAFVVELEILESNNPDRMPGSLCSWMVTLDKEPALGNINQFVCVVGKCKEDQVTEKAMELIISEANPFKGRTVRCVATAIVTKAGHDFTKVKWLEDSVGAEGAAKVEAEQSEA